MALPADYHMHTPLCHHATGEPVEMAAQAVKVGLREIGFSEHGPMPRDDFDDWRMKASDLEVYVAKVEEARRQFPNLTIRLALEVDYLPGYEEWVRDLAARYPWDYFIGSVHYVSESWDIDNPRRVSEWKKRDPMEVWSAYFERLTMAAESKLFEIIGHADLCKKFCFYPQQDCTPLYTRFLEAAKRSDVTLEINTAGLRKDCKEMYPSPAFLEPRGPNGRSDNLRLRRPLARRGGPGPRGSGPVGPECGLHSRLPVRRPQAPDGGDLMGQGPRAKARRSRMQELWSAKRPISYTSSTGREQNRKDERDARDPGRHRLSRGGQESGRVTESGNEGFE